jgi:Tfp pilus assembly protein PilF
MRWICRIAVFCCAGLVSGFAQTDFETGAALFMENKPREALVHLENAIAGDPDNIPAYLYLGIVYEQLGQNDEAVALYRQILHRAGDLTATVATNLGNVYFKKGDTASAERYYTQALEADPGYASACLGRANVRVKAGSLKAAIDDYEFYLSLEPRSSKRADIERLVAFIHSEIAAGERGKVNQKEWGVGNGE